MIKKLLSVLCVVVAIFNLQAQTWEAPIVPGKSLGSLSSTEIVYFYNVKTDAFFLNGMDWNTNACATRLTNGDKAISTPQQCSVKVNNGKVSISLKSFADKYLSCPSLNANDVYVDQTNNYEFSYTEIATGSHVYTLRNVAQGKDLDVTWQYGGHLTLVNGGGNTQWAFIPETAVTNGSYALYKAKKQLYNVYKAVCDAGKESVYNSQLTTAYNAYTAASATEQSLIQAARTLFKAVYADIEGPLNVSFLFDTPDMVGAASISAWTASGQNFNWGEFEQYHAPIELSQTKNVPQGLYDVVLHALYRQDGNDAAPILAATASNVVNVEIPQVGSIDYQVGNANSNDWKAGDLYNQPNGMQSCAQALTHNEAVAVAKNVIVDETGSLAVSVKVTSSNQWFNWQGIEFIYKGVGVKSLKDELLATITIANEWYGDGHYKGAEDFKQVMDQAQIVYNDEQSTANQLIEANEDLLEAIEIFKKASASIERPLDVSSLINNRSFEKGAVDWNQTNMSAQSNTAFSAKEGNTYMEKWVEKGIHVGDAYISQVINNLQTGIYILKGRGQNIQEGSSVLQKNAWIFANNSVTEVTTAGVYTLTFTNIEKNATIGFKAENATGNWLSCDNFELYYAGGEFEDLKKELQNYIASAEPFVVKKMQKPVLETLQNAILVAQNELNATDATNYPNVATPLREAVEAAKVSIRAYESLQKAIDEAEVKYGNGEMNAADKFLAAIQKAKAVNDNLESTQDEMAQEIVNLEKAAFEYLLDNGFGTIPTVVTDKRYARGAIAVFGRMSVSGVPSSDIIEQGFCWSVEPNPTVLDNRSSQYLENNGRIYVMNMEPSTLCYIRAYAITKTYAVGYGEQMRVSTLPKGNVTYWYNDGGDAAQNEKNHTALTIATTYWSNYTSINGFRVTCTFSPGTPTADCGYGGNMRIGTNMGQRAGTCMHEMNHGIGGGTLPIWGGWSSSPLRTSINGDWAGDRANEVVRFWENRNELVITAAYDGAHWAVVPKGETYSQGNTYYDKYPHNGAHLEPGAWAGPKNWNDTEIFYIGNSLINQGFCEDGLIPVNSPNAFCLPAYVFEHHDDKKYYIKNEAEDRGLNSSYLMEGKSKRIQWVEASSEDVAKNDSAAWYISFNPKNQYYQFKNVATGRYLSYTTSGANGVKAADKTTPTLNESFHLMKGRLDVVVGRSNKKSTHRGYWIIHPESKENPECFVANAAKKTGTATLNLYNEAASQRWIILDEEGIQDFETGVKSLYAEELRLLIKDIRKMAETPYVEDVDGIGEVLEQELVAIEGKAESVTTAVDIQQLMEEARAAGLKFLSNATPVDVNVPFDISFLVKNASINDNTGWSTTPAFSNSCAEFFEKTFDFYQRLPGMPAGTYKLMAQALQRPGNYTTTYNDYKAGVDNISTVLYAGTDTKKIKHIASEASEKRVSTEDVSTGSPTVYMPNTLLSANRYFNKNLYDNEVVTQLENDDSNLRVGLKCTTAYTSYWTVFDNFRLYYYGNLSKDDVISDIQDALWETEHFNKTNDVYNLQGVKMGTSLDGLPAGVYIINNKKVFVK